MERVTRSTPGHPWRHTRRGSLAAAGLGGAAGLAACTTGPAGGGGTESRTRQPVTLKLNYRTEQYVPVRARQLSEQYPWLTVELLADTGYEKLVAQIAAGDPGDVIWMSTGVGTYFEMAALGNLMPIEPLVAADKYDLKQQLQVAVETARIVDNKLFGLPSAMHPSHIGLFYNVTLFESAGVKPPTLSTTYDELIDIARRMTGGVNQDGRPAQWGIQTEGSPAAPLLCFMRSFGGELMEPGFLGKRVAFDRAPARQALQYLYDLRHKHRVHPVQGLDTVRFVDGTLAMQTTLMSGGFGYERMIAGRFAMDAVLIPKGPGGKRGSQGHVDMWGMFARTKHKDEAWQLLKWFANKETSQARFVELGVPGARVDGWNDPQVVAKPMFKVFKDFVEQEGPGLVALPWNLRMLEFSDSLIPKSFEPLWSGAMSPEQAIAAAAGPVQQFLDQPRPGAR
ncbi:MAG TPA: sugar ABC transporter substrate-binding protein [Chloroflexota bacterium]|nr:sugar ABC transporter substrate-binding protein [Chloroflexota bacterium]